MKEKVFGLQLRGESSWEEATLVIGGEEIVDAYKQAFRKVVENEEL